jgi:hypothetical protein
LMPIRTSSEQQLKGRRRRLRRAAKRAEAGTAV